MYILHVDVGEINNPGGNGYFSWNLIPTVFTLDVINIAIIKARYKFHLSSVSLRCYPLQEKHLSTVPKHEKYDK